MKQSMRSKIRQVTKDLLTQAGIARPPVNVQAIAEMLNAKVVPAHFGTNPDDISGMLYRDEGQITIGVNSDQHKNRQRFTIAHELGHLKLHNQGALYVDKVFPVRMRNRDSSSAVYQDEIEANAFAAELLMPAFMLEEEPEIMDLIFDYESDDIIQRLAKKYQVSPQAMTFRLITLGYIEQQ